MTQPKTVVLVVALAILLVAGFFFPSPLERISVPPDLIFSLGPIRITNSILGTWLSMLVLLVLGWLGTRNLQLAPTGWLQNLFEMIIEGLLNLVEGVAGHENAKRFFPLVATIFFFIIVNNWMGLVPGFNTWGCFIDDAGHVSPPLCSAESAVRNAPQAAPAAPGTSPQASPAPGVKPAEKHSSVAPSEEIGGRLARPVVAEEAHHFFVPFFRSAATDLNTTLALAIIAVAMIQYWGFQTLGVHYLSKFFTLKGFPIGTFVGLLELISEFSKIISFSFRLFGNIFAGHVLLAVIVYLIPWVGALPFLGLELFVGMIQAFVFAMLTLVFATMATIEHGGEHGAAHDATDPHHTQAHGHAH